MFTVITAGRLVTSDQCEDVVRLTPLTPFSRVSRQGAAQHADLL